MSPPGAPPSSWLALADRLDEIPRRRSSTVVVSGTLIRRPDTELTSNGERPLKLRDGTTSTFLEDGDLVTIAAPASAR